MPAYHELKCIFIHVPKTAGTSFATELKHANGGSVDLAGPSTSAQRARMDWPKDNLQHVTWRDLPKFVAPSIWQDYFAFTIVRNPWSYVRSLYSYERRQDRVERVASMPLATYNRTLLAASLPFSEWLQVRCTAEGPLALHQQIRFVEDGPRELDLVWAGDPAPLWEQLCKRLGLPVTDLPVLNASNSGPIPLSKGDIELVGQHFSEDIAAFGFKPPSVAHAQV